MLGAFVIAITWAKIPGIEKLTRAGLAVASIVVALAGMLVGATGPLVSVLFAQFFANDRKALVATHAAGMMAQHGLKIVVFGLAGFAFWQWLPLIAAMIVSGYLGTVYGTQAARAHAGGQFPQVVQDRHHRAGARFAAARGDGAVLATAPSACESFVSRRGATLTSSLPLVGRDKGWGCRRGCSFDS